jgi:hypothetical protein
MKKLKLLVKKLIFISGTLIFVYGNLFAQRPYSGSGNCLLLDGLNDYTSISDNSTLDIGTGATDDFTIECFFYIPDLNGTGSEWLFYKDLSYQLYITLSNTGKDRIYFRIYVDPINYNYVTYDANLSVGWHHIAASYDNEYATPADAMQVFLDGAMVVNAYNFGYSPGVYNSTSSLYIGGYNGGVNTYNGYIDEVRISDIIRYGSTYTLPTSDSPVDGNTRALWHFNELNGATVFNDATANNNTLTGNNGAHIFGFCTNPTITGTTAGSRCGSGSVTLWATASAGTINWYSAATGGTSLGTGTSFTTPSLTVTTTYYVDATDNGCTTAARTAVTATIDCSTGINSIYSSYNFKVYPNPTNGMIEISINEPIDCNYKIELLDNLGNLLKTILLHENENTTQIDLSEYPAGLYLIKIDTNKGISQCKIIKE